MNSYESSTGYHPVGGGTIARNNICHYCGRMKLSRIIFLLIVFLLLVPLITHYFLSKVILNTYLYKFEFKLLLSY